MGATSEDTFRILVATDNHLGFAEKDTVRGNDSFETFEEILELGVQENVDLILLGGDLFHENKPSRQCIVRCMELLRKYTFGDRPVLFDFVSDPVENFKHAKNPVVNYQDPNLNVAIPVFSIHGNHDDPSGMGQFCALDMLSTAGLVNYFGRTTDLKEINISPILLEKGRTKLALFGLSAIKDERLFRLFMENKVKMLRPKESMDDWFNIMVLHQNHTRHSMTNYLPEAFLDSFLHLVIWGHEHECLIDPRQTGEDSFFVMQPGSSVATSLCAGEAVEKKVAILEVTHDKRFKIHKHKLNTIRPFVFDDLCLADQDMDQMMGSDGSAVAEFVEEHIRQMLVKAEDLLTGHPRQPKKPLIRLRVEYTHESQMFNTVRFGHKFEEDVANPRDMILFKKHREEKKKKEDIGVDKDAMDAIFEDDVSQVRVEDLVEQYFADLGEDGPQLYLLTERGLARSVSNFVEKDDRDAIAEIVKHQIKKTSKHLMELEVEAEDAPVVDEIREHRRQRLERRNPKQEEEEAVALLDDPNRNRSRVNLDDDDDGNVSSDFEIEDSSAKPARGRGSRGGRARGGRGSRAASTAASKAASIAASKAASSASANTSRGARGRTQLTLAGDGSPKTSGTRGRGRGQTMSRQSSIMDSFARGSQKASSNRSRRGVMFDSDSD